MQMKDIEEGAAYTVASPYAEADAGFGNVDAARVKATVVAKGFEFQQPYGGREPQKNGVRVRLEEDFRHHAYVAAGQYKLKVFRVGHEFDVPSRDVLWPWGRAAQRIDGSADDERSRIRAQRYAEQNTIREVCEKVGLVPALKGGRVEFDREQLAAWLVAVDDRLGMDELAGIAAPENDAGNACVHGTPAGSWCGRCHAERTGREA